MLNGVPRVADAKFMVVELMSEIDDDECVASAS